MNAPHNATALRRPGYQLSDNLWAPSGSVFITGTQALIRVLVMQGWRDAARGLHTQGFVSGYRGSPLGMVDQAIWKAGERFKETGIRFVPAVNEELAATQVLGTQRVESDPERTVDGVFAMWYGKGPGVDRAGDALKHGNAYGSSPHGGVLVVAGDDHGCVSSSMPHQSDHAFMAWRMPVMQPSCVAEYLEFGLYGYELSRYSGAWVGMAALSEVVESAGTVDLDVVNARVQAWEDADTVRAATGHQAPADGLHYRWPDLPSLRIESRLEDKLAAVAAFTRRNSIDRDVIVSEHAKVGIVTCGKAHHDLMEVLRRLELSPEQLARAGVRLYKIGLSFPVEQTRIKAFAKGLEEILIVEEKGAVVETQLRDIFYNAPADARPVLVGKHDRAGQPLVSALGELRPSRLIELVAHWLAVHFPDNRDLGDHLQHVRDFTPPELLGNASDAVKRLPYFCAGCPHNTSTKVPEGSTARAGIGCHFMANWMDRSTAGLIQMGGEGVDWISHAMFTKTPHVFQNLGDGTYYHSGYLAIRQAVAAKATLTYKILFNDAVAMTGGQPVDGVISVDAIARQVESEGVSKVVVVSDAIGKYDDIKGRFPQGTEFHDRAALDDVQRRLREMQGVTVLIYEQTCAAEKRRRRKKGEMADPPKRLFINEAVCEGCGDCTVQSNCVAVLPHETPMGRKRKIDQTSCNKDYSCAKGFCPSFVGVTGGKLRRKSGALAAGRDAFLHRVAALQHPAAHAWNAPYDLLVTGVGGTGVVTVGAVIAMAAHLEGKAASVLDFMGFAQKGGSVLSFVRLADSRERLHQVRIDTQQADAILACDVVVGASADALQTVRHGRTRVLANIHEIPVAESLRNPDADLHVDLLLEKMRFVAGEEQVETFDAQSLAEEFLGDTLAANIVATGYAWQRGLVPLSLEALMHAIELNGVAVAANQSAFSLGRLAAGDPAALDQLRAAPAADAQSSQADERPLDMLIADARRHLTGYQNAAWADRFEKRIRGLQAREAALQGGDSSLPFTRNAARSLLKLMSYKDEYEVARLYTDGAFLKKLSEQFEGELKLEFHMAPPVVARGSHGRAPAKIRVGSWMLPAMRWLAHGKRLRGTAFDPFGRTGERRAERELISHFDGLFDAMAGELSADNQSLAARIAALPMSIRGFGHVKLANLEAAQVREAELLHRFAPSRYPKPASAPGAGQIRGIAIVAGAR
ncbi:MULTISPECIES: indolepyruvate ferredoxin oxidoreductase family protein [Variovorax]|jgi:indolepyruvate ferredoxin oxidoreductase|uniref:indolepyruvate ferredoxin oxidoreductase family protein n=1 Tax=Variovorax TaxID=34072 RepID=UPI00086A0B3A|nr:MULTISPECIES: indolepyruvate ferredoxin oxidoreductase family protein [Variovorax]MBN8757296.1 indolepyruvate ferredoxin oxidoreductase family protein [Variovorax sp.]ODU17986.1 MAG: pyruvate ferredoxin oxidoreductase [Variovorax sp. SCN 67-85]ODV24521.1 MAG: pyruvate ferredoxin oxidoreductase [Variovorax sp. SCN 67-20]OJZ13540.1 MAG: pyruvate ferredoxin oxidoreductase [Variovorax sp. 67-131]UKI06187.1 indolepyruvate ferredoxin oxidoreductase family protein [Variovorax paradoxus]